MLWRALGLALALWAIAPSAAARPARAARGLDASAEQALGRLRLSIERARLKNGLQVVMDVDHDAPGVAVVMIVRVGARDEQPNQSGFSAWIERAMFGGSRHVKAGELLERVRAAGGRAGSVASPDATAYFEVLPASELALGLWLEADRLRFLSLDNASLDRARRAVERARGDRSVDRVARLRLREIAFEDAPAYGHDPLGSGATLARAKPGALRAFHDAFYAPNNAVLSVAGDIDADQVMSLVHRYFDGARAGEPPPAAPPAALGRQSSERLAVLHSKDLTTPELVSGWALPPERARDRDALELALDVLTSGPSSRLGVSFAHLARSMKASVADHLVALRLVLADNVRENSVEHVLRNEIFALGRHGPHASELARAKAGLETRWFAGLQSNLGRALALGRAEAFSGDARLVTRELAGFVRVTPRDVQRAVREDLVPARHTMIEVYPLRAAATAKRPRRPHVRRRVRRPGALRRARDRRSAARTPKPKRLRNGTREKTSETRRRSASRHAARASKARLSRAARRAVAARKRAAAERRRRNERAEHQRRIAREKAAAKRARALRAFEQRRRAAAAARRARDRAARKKLERAAELRRARARAAKRKLEAAAAKRRRARERAKRLAEQRAERIAQHKARARERAKQRALQRAARRRALATRRAAQRRALAARREREAKLRARERERRAHHKTRRHASRARKKPSRSRS